jgi:hypothetical protein
MFRDARKGQFEWRNRIAPLFGDRVVLLAMKHQRARGFMALAERQLKIGRRSGREMWLFCDGCGPLEAD